MAAMEPARNCGGMALFLVIWFCVSFTPGGAASRMRMDREQPAESGSGEMDRSNCRPYLREDFLDVDGSGVVNSEGTLPLEDHEEQATILQTSPARTIQKDFLRSQNLPLQVSGEEASPINWLMPHLLLLFGRIATPRRHLADETSRAAAPTPATAPVPSPALSPAPSSPATPPFHAPAPSPDLASLSPGSYVDPPPDDSPEQISPLKPDNEIPRGTPTNKDGNKRGAIVALVLSVAAALFLTTILIHYCNGGKVDSGSRLRDDRPLLALSSSNFSAGSSHRSLDLRDSPEIEKRIEPRFFQREADHDKQGDTSSPTISAEPAASSTASPKIEPKPMPPPPPAPLMPSPAKKPPQPPLPPRSARPGAAPPPPPKGASSARPDRAGKASEAPKTKLKPFFWDKVLANPDQSMVWHQISSGSFQFNEEMIESLFGYSATKPKSGDDRKPAGFEPSPQLVQLLEPKKAQNLAILLKALNVTVEEVRDALMEGAGLPAEVMQTLIKMAPTAEEELKLRLYDGEMSALGPAERFLKALVDIPFAFKRLDAMLLVGSLEEDISSIKQDLRTIEAACEELKGSRLFKKVLEAVVKIGNRMNDGTYRGGARAFKLDTLLKLADVKGADGKTTLLHFLVHEIVLSEGLRAHRAAAASSASSGAAPSPDTQRLGLKVLVALPSELEHVRTASFLDAAAISGGAAELGRALLKTRGFLEGDMEDVAEEAFKRRLRRFVEAAEAAVAEVQEEEKRVSALVKRTSDFFHGDAGKEEGLRLFVVVRDFLAMLERACREVNNAAAAAARGDVERPPAAGERRWRRSDLSGSEDEGSP